jgi:hypothetical protein
MGRLLLPVEAGMHFDASPVFAAAHRYWPAHFSRGFPDIADQMGPPHKAFL